MAASMGVGGRHQGQAERAPPLADHDPPHPRAGPDWAHGGHAIQARESSISGPINALYALHTGQPIDPSSGTWIVTSFMSAEEAKAYGLVDAVFTRARTLVPHSNGEELDGFPGTESTFRNPSSLISTRLHVQRRALTVPVQKIKSKRIRSETHFQPSVYQSAMSASHSAMRSWRKKKQEHKVANAPLGLPAPGEDEETISRPVCASGPGRRHLRQLQADQHLQQPGRRRWTISDNSCCCVRPASARPLLAQTLAVWTFPSPSPTPTSRSSARTSKNILVRLSGGRRLERPLDGASSASTRSTRSARKSENPRVNHDVSGCQTGTPQDPRGHGRFGMPMQAAASTRSRNT